VAWSDTKEYVAWLSRRTGKTYRLLSEAEWEYAARGATTTRYAFGDTISKSQAQFNAPKTVEVGPFPANGFGLHDLHGNVREWVEDAWHPNYESTPVDGSVWFGRDKATVLGIVRGGAWDFSYPRRLRSASRDLAIRFFGKDDIGFGVARTL
jgi:formylglycine-generating enzyme required for sulfatase activity